MINAFKNQLKVNLLSIKYAIMREMLNKTTFIMNVVFMMLNNASFIIQWLILYSLKDNVGGYNFSQVLLLWGVAAGTYGISRFFFRKAFSLSELITNGKLDSFLVQPKNVLLSIITSEVEPSAMGDLFYAYIILFVSGCTPLKFILFTFFIICGGFILASFAVMFGSVAFWISRSEMFADTMNSFLTNFATYPDGIFKNVIKILLYTLIPVGFTSYIPVKVMTQFDIRGVLIVLGVTIISITLAFVIFFRGLRRYSSSNLMISKI